MCGRLAYKLSTRLPIRTGKLRNSLEVRGITFINGKCRIKMDILNYGKQFMKNCLI